MKIKVINPNTSVDMTRSIGAAARRYARPETELVTVSPERGPITIEDHYDAVLAAVGAMELPVAGTDDLLYWNDMLLFLNKNKGKSFTVQMDGVSYSLHAG